ncbi:CPBP family intramembrane metalloprotease [Candidatus Saccharibacteria bacterium]|nr:CPBP family intramembrane metalloprotease [Candidatus Saccharibacteria bacterium]
MFGAGKKIKGPTKKRDLIAILLTLLLLILTPINTDISIGHMLFMGLTLSLAIIIPYYIYKNDAAARIKFHYRLDSGWNISNYSYVLLAAIIGYLIFPFYFSSTGAYTNWPNPENNLQILLLFIGTNALGIWDELFFVNTLLGIFKRYVKFWAANILQAILWTVFLYELGFVGWIPPLIFIFALIQGYTFKVTHSLGFLIAVHLAIDFMLFLAILDAHGRLAADLFITN